MIKSRQKRKIRRRKMAKRIARKRKLNLTGKMILYLFMSYVAAAAYFC